MDDALPRLRGNTERIVWVDLGLAAAIDKAVALWREAITTPPYKVAADLSAKVRELTWAKLRQALPPGTKVVYLSPDLGLTRLPWSALPGDKPGTLVLEEFAVAVVPHGPFLLDHLWPPDANPRSPQGLLAVGGVAYDDKPARPAPDRLAAAERLRAGPALKPGQKLSWGMPIPRNCYRCHRVLGAPPDLIQRHFGNCCGALVYGDAAAFQTGSDSPNALFRPRHAGEYLLLRCLPGGRSAAVLIIPSRVAAMEVGALDGWRDLRRCDR